MTGGESNVGEAVDRFHEDVPHRFRVSLTMSMDTRDTVSEVRDRLNDEAGSRTLTTDDVMRLSLLAAARYHALSTGDAETDAVDDEQLVPLTAAIRRTLGDDDRVPSLEE